MLCNIFFLLKKLNFGFIINKDLGHELVPILVNFLTLDICHFGAQAVDNAVVSNYATNICNTAISNHHYQQQQQQLQNQQQGKVVVQASVINGKCVVGGIKSTPSPLVVSAPSSNVTTSKSVATATAANSLLHQTLQHQHALSSSSSLVKINSIPSQQQNSMANFF